MYICTYIPMYLCTDDNNWGSFEESIVSQNIVRPTVIIVFDV